MTDAVVTERGIAIHPSRKDLMQAVAHSGMPIRDLRDIQREVFDICGGKPVPPVVDAQHPIAVVKWVDGSLLETVYRVKT